MTLNEWQTRWATGKIDDVPGEVVNAPGKPTIWLRMERHEAPLGSFIEAYTRHLMIPWWRRGPFWKLIGGWMREKLDTIAKVTWHSR